MILNRSKEEEASRLRGSLLEFCRFFYKHLTGRDLIVSNPAQRESHHITLCRELTILHREPQDYYGLCINMPPGYGKTLFVSMFIAWCYAHNADCNFLYVSYSSELATKATAFIKTILNDELFSYLFDVHLRRDSNAKDDFKTTLGGNVVALGSLGSVTGQNAGLPDQPRFTGALIIDDPIKPGDAHSDKVRNSILENYRETLSQRTRGKYVPIIFMGQRVHEQDLAAFFFSENEIRRWKKVELTALDDNDMALYPEIDTRDKLIAMREKSPYVFWSQYQQKPVPAGGALFKRDWFVQLEEEPQMSITFITVDSAETTKEYNDATVFSFWGVYDIQHMGMSTGQTGLHWIDCMELRIEPKDLLDYFNDFYGSACRYPVPPGIAAIEKKSTGVTMVSSLKEARGIKIWDIPRSGASGSKSDRFVEIQRWVAEKRISINAGAKHKELVLKHMEKITANDAHRFDDIADTCADAIRLVFIENRLQNTNKAIDNTTASRIMRPQKILLNTRSGVGHDSI